MLQSIRDRLTGPIVWFVVGLIAIPFAFWGIDSFRTDGGDPTVVKVGDQKITQAQLRQTYEQRYQQYRSLLGESFRADLFDENRFRQLTLDDMVQESALRQFAESQGYQASDASLRDFLTSVPAFQKDGQFSAQTYRELLERQGLQPEPYEAQLRESLAIDQLRSAVQSTSFVSPEEAWTAYRLEKQSRRIAVLQVAASDFRNDVQVSDAQITERYERDKAQFMAPERLKLAYVELDRNKLGEAQPPAPEVLRVIYDAEKDGRFTSTEERRASHILIGFGADKSEAKQKAEKLVPEARTGGDFKALASENSEDPGSKDKGGDLGWVRRGMMVPDFENALFKLKDGEIVGPVETEFGWHVIRLDEIKAPHTRAFENADVQVELVETYRNREGEKRFQELSSKLEQLAFENTSLEPVAEAVEAQIQITDWMTRAGGPGIAAIEAVRQAAFSPEVLQDGENSKPITASADALIVLRKSEYEPARQLSLDEVKERVRDALMEEGAAVLARKSADTILEEVRAGKSLAEVAGSRQLALQFEGEVTRDTQTLDGPVLDAVFRMPQVGLGTLQSEVVGRGAGDLAVVVMSEVIDPARPTETEVLDEYRTQLSERMAGAEFTAYRKFIERDVEVEKINAPQVDPAAEPDEGL
ncbi:MAG: SurA N-terminal domain-containing protein [Panacagrimonas sp.]